jgi:hypothetical protein
MSDVFLVVGFLLASCGVYLIGGLGWACFAAGLTLFIAGGLNASRKPNP